MNLADWVEKKGGCKATGDLLGVTRQCVYSWVTGKASPTATMMREIIRRSRGAVSPADLLSIPRKKILKKKVRS